jgi:ABC-2 type transport system permease protein
MTRRPPGFMRGTSVVLRREWAASFDTAIAYVAAIGFMLLANTLFMNEFFLLGQLDMTPFFERLPQLAIVFVPALAMRLWAEERRTRNFETIVTLPLRPLQLVLGKFVAALALYCLALAGSTPIVVMLLSLGQPDLGLVAAGYLGAFLLGALLIALGSWLSALSSDQVVAFILTALVSAGLVLSGDARVIAILDSIHADWRLGTLGAETLSLLPHYDNFVRGIVELSSVAYFVVLTTAALLLCSLTVAKDRT